MVKPKIIHEDNDLMIINKPSGWVVNEATTAKALPVIQRWLTEEFDYEIAKDRDFRSGIVHRLDKPTSGCLIIAKNKKAFKTLQKYFKRRKVTKYYQALVHGKVEPGKGLIKTPVGRLPWNRRRFGVMPGGRDAETGYSVINYYTKEDEIFSLVEFRPKTGRTHQIRIHAKYMKHPVVSDELYAGRKTYRSDINWCPRLFLHAARISFVHPAKGKKVTYESELPEDLQKTLGSLDQLNRKS